MTREWDARTYDALPLPHEAWGTRTLRRLSLEGHETVLDAGCGTGRDTADLIDALPQGRVIAVDASRRMLDRLERRLDGRLARVDVVHADLQRQLPDWIRVDAVFSVAAFHWIPDHDALFGHLAEVLRPGGRLVAEFGGIGNVASIEAALSDLGVPVRPWNFPQPDITAERLSRAGFVRIQAELRPDPLRLDDEIAMAAYLRAVVLGAHLDRVPPEERAAFVDAVMARLPEPVIDYVRLELTATRAGP